MLLRLVGENVRELWQSLVKAMGSGAKACLLVGVMTMTRLTNACTAPEHAPAAWATCWLPKGGRRMRQRYWLA